MRVALKAAYEKLTQAANDGSVLLDPSCDIFEPIAKVQPLFAEWRRHFFEVDHVMSPDGTTPHLLFQLVRDELFNPKDTTNQRTRLKTIEYLEVQCRAALEKMDDQKLPRTAPQSQRRV